MERINMELTLGDVQTTALIPLAIKANETKSPKARINDQMAVQIIDSLALDTKPFDKFLSHEGVIARTIMLDNTLKQMLQEKPDSVIVNLGCGFDNRFERVDNGKILWFDLDLADSIAARKKAFPERERVTMLVGNVLENDWTKEIPKDKNLIFIAEGLFMYLTMDEIKQALTVLKESFKSGTLIAEQNSKFMMKNQKHHDTVKNTKAVFKSGTDSAQEIADLVPGFKLVEERSFNEEMKKHSIRAKIFAALFGKFNDRWATFTWA